MSSSCCNGLSELIDKNSWSGLLECMSKSLKDLVTDRPSRGDFSECTGVKFTFCKAGHDDRAQLHFAQTFLSDGLPRVRFSYPSAFIRQSERYAMLQGTLNCQRSTHIVLFPPPLLFAKFYEGRDLSDLSELPYSPGMCMQTLQCCMARKEEEVCVTAPKGL